MVALLLLRRYHPFQLALASVLHLGRTCIFEPGFIPGCLFNQAMLSVTKISLWLLYQVTIQGFNTPLVQVTTNAPLMADTLSQAAMKEHCWASPCPAAGYGSQLSNEIGASAEKKAYTHADLRGRRRCGWCCGGMYAGFSAVLCGDTRR
jgi:hypothetical protein